MQRLARHEMVQYFCGNFWEEVTMITHDACAAFTSAKVRLVLAGLDQLNFPLWGLHNNGMVYTHTRYFTVQQDYIVGYFF